MTGNVDRSILDFLTLQFEKEHIVPTGMRPSYPMPAKDGTPIKAETREWGQWKFTGFGAFRDPDDGAEGWSAQLLGQRSDGQLFYVAIRLPLRFSMDPELGDPVEYVKTKLMHAVLHLDSFRDCSCGIMGYEQTGEKDEDGQPETRVVASPCERHPKREVVVEEEEPTDANV